MYLSELFLLSAGEDMSMENVKRAVDICNGEMLQRMGEFQNEEACCLYFFDGSGEERRINAAGQEILDFWDVYREFDEEMEQTMKDESEILKVGRWMCSIRENDIRRI